VEKQSRLGPCRSADHPRPAHPTRRVVERQATVSTSSDPPAEYRGVEVGRTIDIGGRDLDVADLPMGWRRGHLSSFLFDRGGARLAEEGPDPPLSSDPAPLRRKYHPHDPTVAAGLEPHQVHA